jgi:hypothetical protein
MTERFSYKPAEGKVQKTTESGATISISSRQEQRKRPSETAWHESAHIVASGRIKSATIIPSGDALGSTTPEVMTPAAAAAAAADGHGGTGWDKFLTERILGLSFASAKAAARAALSGKGLEKEEVAIALEEKGTIGQSDVDEAYEKASNRRNGIIDVFIEVEDIDGNKNAFHTETLHGEVQIPTNLIKDKEILLYKRRSNRNISDAWMKHSKEEKPDSDDKKLAAVRQELAEIPQATSPSSKASFISLILSMLSNLERKNYATSIFKQAHRLLTL